MNRRHIFLFLFTGALLLGLALENISPAIAKTITELQQEILLKNSDIQKLEAEIAQYEKELSVTKKETTTLKEAINRLNISKKKLETDIAVTQKRIDSISLNIERLGIDIAEKTESISYGKEVIGETLRQMRRSEATSALVGLLAYPSLGDLWEEVDRLETMQTDIRTKIEEMQNTKVVLVTLKTEAEESQKKLKEEKSTLSDQRSLVLENQKEKTNLLTETKNKESNYEKLLRERREKKKQFEDEMRAAEEALREALDPKSLPTYRAGVLDWPLTRIIITQYFGDTPFSRSNPQIYAGKGHNGVDFGAPSGTPILAPRDGVVKAIGNTDTACPNASYGRWMLVEHDNGLSTLYAHLSLHKATVNTPVKKGEVIAYVGQSGYATGPHLHFVVFASEGVAVQNLPSRACGGKVYVVPLPTKTGAVLNPLLYLPDIS